MERNRLGRSLVSYCVLALLLVAVLMLGSGRPEWTRAWIYIGGTFFSQVAVALTLVRVSPDLLVERQRIREGTKSWDKLLVALVGIVGPFAMWFVAARDVHSHWPPPVTVAESVAGFALCFGGAFIMGWAMIANRFFASTVRIQTERGHAVVDGGPYRYVRHPGYVGAGLFTLASPIALGSWWAMIPAVVVVAVLALRTVLEDRTLHGELEGYKEYASRVPNRLIPGVW